MAALFKLLFAVHESGCDTYRRCRQRADTSAFEGIAGARPTWSDGLSLTQLADLACTASPGATKRHDQFTDIRRS